MPDRQLTDALIEVVRERMEQEGLSQGALSRAADVTQQTLSKHLRGLGTPTVDDFDALARALRTDLTELIEAARRRM